MTLPELKSWLDGYMAGAGDKADAAVIVAKVKEVTEPLSKLTFPQGVRVNIMEGAQAYNPDSSGSYFPNQNRTVAVKG